MSRPSRESVARNIGFRVWWWDEPEHPGTIVGIAKGRGGWWQFVVEWDEGAPDWWVTHLSAASRNLIVREVSA